MKLQSILSARAFCLILLFLLGSFTVVCKNKKESLSTPAPSSGYAGIAEAPDFPSHLDWLNTDTPISLKNLKGKIVILDFWTYCCINCMHVIPDLKKLEKKWEKELIVIGVHSAKFTNEQGTENIRQAILRYEVDHPVVNDSDFLVWRNFGINAWPSFVILDPDGKVLGKHSGEDVFELFDELIGKMVDEFDRKGKINREPLSFLKPERFKSPETILSFPGKTTINEKGDKLYISDSNHNRILEVNPDTGDILRTIGSGKTSFIDGSFQQAGFNKPQGLFLKENKLYVADTENHSIRMIDLVKETVTTLAGTGEQARTINVGGIGKKAALNSPWDLTEFSNKLYIAMAGPHQIWYLDLKSLETEVYAGSGRENIIDGILPEAALAQPSGITRDSLKLYFADSEVSAVRSADLFPRGEVKTIIGKGLFEFGDIDGKYPEARLQHPLGIHFLNKKLYVADTYNHKIKIVDPASKTVSTLAGTGKKGTKDGEFAGAEFNEPSGITYYQNKLYVADTNNHLIRILDLEKKTVSTLAIKPEKKVASSKSKNKFTLFSNPIHLGDMSIHPDSEMILLGLKLPAGYKWNTSAPFYFAYFPEDKNVLTFPTEEENIENPGFPLRIPVSPKQGTTTLKINAILYYCEAEKEKLCLIQRNSFTINAKIQKNGVKNPVIEYNVLGR